MISRLGNIRWDIQYTSTSFVSTFRLRDIVTALYIARLMSSGDGNDITLLFSYFLHLSHAKLIAMVIISALISFRIKIPSLCFESQCIHFSVHVQQCRFSSFVTSDRNAARPIDINQFSKRLLSGT